MHAIIASGFCANMQIEIPFEDFLGSGHIRVQAKVAMCTPDDLIIDYLPAFDPADADEVREAFGEACEQAADGGLNKVRLDDDDVLFARRHFLRSRRFRLAGELYLDAA